MDLKLDAGTYVVAVSGGVDSITLLHMLVKEASSEHKSTLCPQPFALIVAHFDHGIRSDSRSDRLLVQAITKKYGLQFIYDEGNLGLDASEDMARQARYKFLRSVRDAVKANAILTAHHQDDLLETAVLNMLRGTGRRGMVALRSRDDIIRPLLSFPKLELITYARENHLHWAEDSTNQDNRYLRNAVRNQLLTRFSEEDRQQMLAYIDHLAQLHNQIEQHLNIQLNCQPEASKLGRQWFISLPHVVAKEIMATWLHRHQVHDVSRRRIEQLVIASKTLNSGKRIDVDKQWYMRVYPRLLALEAADR